MLYRGTERTFAHFYAETDVILHLPQVISVQKYISEINRIMEYLIFLNVAINNHLTNNAIARSIKCQLNNIKNVSESLSLSLKYYIFKVYKL